MGAGRIAWPPFLPVGIGRLDVDKFAPEPNAAQSQMGIEPGVSLNELLKLIFGILQQQTIVGPVDRQLGPDRDRRFGGGVDDPRLVVYVIDTKLDLMLDAARLNDRDPCRVVIAA